MKRLWAPWRMQYLGPLRKAEPTGCLFCRVWKAKEDRRELVLARRDHALLMLNRFPYNAGHLMVAVARHAARFEVLTPPERADLLELVAVAERILDETYHPHGLNYGANVGRVAGAGFPGHLHIHLVPRWDGDTNFMPIVAETKVLPETLSQTWTRLRAAVRGARQKRGSGGRRGR